MDRINGTTPTARNPEVQKAVGYGCAALLVLVGLAAVGVAFAIVVAVLR